jgi:hypothetical protein
MPVPPPTSIDVQQATALPEGPDQFLRSAVEENFAHFVRFSTVATSLSWAVARQAGEVVGWAPVVRLERRAATATLRREVRRWIGWLGPAARKTTLLVDTAFLAYDEASPFRTVEGADRVAVKRAIASHLQSGRGVDSVWITEPLSESTWLAGNDYLQFHTLPMAQVELGGARSMSEFVQQLSKKRRRNAHHAQRQFAAAGATISVHQGPLTGASALSEALESCLCASARQSQFVVPYNDVLTHRDAFREQAQTFLVARAGERVIGFMSFLEDAGRLLQCHGGLDYDRSHVSLAYHNLILAAIEMAIRRGCQVLGMGPLNNETKRRAATTFWPMVANLWNRNPLDRMLAARFFVPNLEVYGGPVAQA